VHTDSRKTIDSLHNENKHTYLAHEIRQNVDEMEIREWRIRFKLMKAHAGTSGDELDNK